MYGTLYPIAYLDPPQVFDASVTPIPAISSLPLQVISNIGHKASLAIDYIDTTGQYIGIYYGPVGQEQIATIIGGGLSSRSWCVIPHDSRVSFRAMYNSTITNGRISCIFMGLGL